MKNIYKKIFIGLILVMMVAISNILIAQNAVVGSGFTNGWSSTGNFEYLGPSAGSSYIKTDAANGTGNQYFRMGVDWGGTIGQHTVTIGSDVEVFPNTEITLNSTATGSGAMYLSVASTSHKYIFKTQNAGSTPSFKLIIFKVEGDICSVSSVTKDLTTVYPGQAVTVSASLDGSLSTGQSVYLRYTKDNFVNSTVVEMTGSGTTYTANIPSDFNTSNAPIKYYVFTSGNGLSPTGANSDWYTINLNNNTGSNYSYTVANSWITNADGNWSSPLTWLGGVVPAPGQPITIAHNVTLDQDVTISSVTINSNKTLTVNTSNTLQSAGAILNNGAITVNGTLQLNSGGFISNNAPTYATGSTLVYNSGNTYDRSVEWSAGLTGQGVPFNVKVNAGSTVNMDRNSGTGDARTVRGKLTLAGSMSFKGTSNIGSGTIGGLTVNGDLLMEGGTLTLGHYINPNGSDLILMGNWERTSGSFDGNGRAVFLDGTSNTSITTNTATVINYLYIRKTNSASVTLNNELQIANVATINNGATLNCGIYPITGNGIFTLSAGATLGIGSPDGITTSGSTGNIRLATRNFDAGANYVYNGSTAQVTGNALPSTINNLTIDNATGVKLSNTALTVSGTMLINSGKLFTLESGKQLTVTGTLTNNATATGLVIKSDATGTGSLISSNEVAATVERFLTKYNSIDDKMYHFLSSPVSGQAIRTEFVTSTPSTGHDFYSFNEQTNTWINSKASDGSWNGSFDATFLIGKGYLVAYPDTITKKFKGTLNSYPSESPLELNCTNTAGQGNGWNLLGNPFPSPIDWALITKGDGIDNALYYYDNAQQNYRYYLQLGSIGSLGGGSQYIPAMQGFMVHANTTGTNKKVIISNTARTHTGQNVFYKSVNTELKGISLKASANGYEDEAIIYFLDGATAGFDGEYDAFKLKSYSVNVPMISTTSSDGNELAINGLPAFDKANVIPVNFKADLAGDYTLSANLLSFNDNEVYLTDKKLNQDLKISENPVYTFTSEAGDDPNRFELRFMTPTGLEKTSTKSSLRVYTTNGKINISGVDGKAEVYVRNIVGQVFLRNSVNGSTLQSFNTSNLPAGIYMVSVVSATKTVSQKVVVK